MFWRRLRGSPRLVLALVAGALLLLFTVALTPVTVISAAVPDGSNGSDVVGTPQPTVIDITTRGGEVAFTMPRLTPPETFSSDLIADSGPFRLSPIGRFIAVAPGTFEIKGDFGDLEVDFMNVDNRADVTVTRTSGGSSTAHRVLFTGAPLSWQTVEVPAHQGTRATNAAYLFRGFDVRPGSVVAVGDHTVTSPSQHVSSTTLLPVVLRAALRGWLILALGFAIAFACWAVGRAALGLIGAREPPTSVALAGGLAFIALSVNSLAYVLPVRIVAILFVAACVVFAAFLLLRRRRSCVAVVRREGARFARRAAIVVPAAVIGFWPLFFWGPWYAGMYQTDLYEYAQLSSIVRRHPLIAFHSLAEAKAAGTLTADAGFIWRSVDSVAASLASTLTGTSTLAGFVILGVVLFITFAIGVVDLARRLTTQLAVLAAIAVIGPAMLGLYLQDYLSQYFFVAFIPAFVVAVVHVVDLAEVPVGRALLWALAAIAAVMIAAYPYFFVVVAVATAIGLLSHRDGRRALRRTAVPLSVRALVLTNVALITVVRFGDTNRYESPLDAIARNVLLSGWDRFDVGTMALGWRSFQQRAIPVEGTVTASLRTLETWARWAVTPTALWTILGLVAVVGLLLAADIRSTLASLDARVVIAIVAGWTVFAALYELSDRPYIFLKSAWVAGALIPCLITVTRWRPARLGVATASLTLLAVMWVGTSLADRVAWLVPPQSAQVRTSHVSTVPDLAMLSANLGRLGDDVRLVNGSEPIEGSDHDRVLVGHITVMLRDNAIGCSNCTAKHLPPSDVCTNDGATSIISVGLSGAEEQCGLRLLGRGSYIEIYGKGST